ncbi:hypothetical protein FRC14_005671 [Serendipita sp. 396]|nr:hypothetical protein FRC14_005671 [Serendipita sp. 396]KAG8802535.1 hypothetical protein FRC16_009381 [Serendipita sp. 398]
MNIFQLPHELLENIVSRTLINVDSNRSAAEEQTPTKFPSSSQPTGLNKQPGPRLMSCTVCLGTVFTDSEDQRAHYRSDWHRYNVKAKLLNKPVLNETAFENAVANLSDSISGSESSDSDAEGSETDAVQSALKRARVSASGPASLSDDDQDSRQQIPKTALQWFHSPPSTQIGVYRAVFPLKTELDAFVPQLRKLQEPVDGGRYWTLLMIAGGHFAGMVVKIGREKASEATSTGKSKGKHKPTEYEIIAQKTFHRYTTRRKQGGSQSLNDNAKGNAKSAGAQLRRYGEQALRDDIRNLMKDWEDDVGASERIWIRSNVLNKRIFYDYEDAVFARDDDRLRGFPFPTRRPTHTELLRCLNELIHAKTTRYTEAELKEQDEHALSLLPKPKPAPSQTQPAPAKSKPKPEVPKLTKEQEAQRDIWMRILEMTKKGRLESLQGYFEKVQAELGGTDARVPNLDGLDPEDVGCTLLHIASSSSQEEVVQWLLEQANANPTLRVPFARENGEGESSDAGRTPYEVAGSKSVRDTFRRLAGIYPDRWDWLNEGRIPSVLSKELEEEQDSKKKTRRKGLKEKMKEREERNKSAASGNEDDSDGAFVGVSGRENKPAASKGPQKLGGTSGSASSVLGLTPEMRAKLERERRARAIEQRMQSAKQ